jgi:hypothetical protein
LITPETVSLPFALTANSRQAMPGIVLAFPEQNLLSMQRQMTYTRERAIDKNKMRQRETRVPVDAAVANYEC